MNVKEKIKRYQRWNIIPEPEDVALWLEAENLSQIIPYLDTKNHPILKSLQSIPHENPADKLSIARDILHEYLHSNPELLINLLLIKLIPDLS